MLGFESAIATRSQSTLQPALPTNSGHFMKNLDQPHFYLEKKVIRRNRTMTLKIETEHWTANCSILVLFPQFQFILFCTIPFPLPPRLLAEEICQLPITAWKQRSPAAAAQSLLSLKKRHPEKLPFQTLHLKSLKSGQICCTFNL